MAKKIRQPLDSIDVDVSSRMHLILNRRFATVKCLACGKLLISRHVHDCRTCGCCQETMVDGGPAYLHCGGADMSLLEILVDPEWPRHVRLDLLQEATRLAMQMGCRFEPPRDARDSEVAAVVLRLRGCVATAAGMSEAAREVLVNTGLWPQVAPGQPPIDMIRPIPGRISGDCAHAEIGMSTKGTIRHGDKYELYEDVIEAISEPGFIHLVLRDVSFSAGSGDGRGWVDLRLSRELAIDLGLLR